MSFMNELQGLQMPKMYSDTRDPSERGWMPAHCAPMDVPLSVRVRDEHGIYNLKSCIVRKVNPETGKLGWFNSERETWLVVPVADWKYHPTYVPERKKPVRTPKG